MDTINVVDEGAVRVVTMDRPDALNAVSRQMMDELADAFLDAAADDSVKVLVLTGAGRAFSAGADISEMDAVRRPEQRHGLVGMIESMIDFPKPFIVAVNGIGAGYGATVCGLADLVFMSQEARLRCPFSALGLTPELGSTYSFPRVMGHQRAAWFLLSAEWMSGPECVEAGLALEAVEPEALMARVMEQAGTLAALPLASLMMTKNLMAEPHRQAMKDAVRHENRGLVELLGAAANAEAITAFREKRKPDFTGM